MSSFRDHEGPEKTRRKRQAEKKVSVKIDQSIARKYSTRQRIKTICYELLVFSYTYEKDHQ